MDEIQNLPDGHVEFMNRAVQNLIETECFAEHLSDINEQGPYRPDLEAAAQKLRGAEEILQTRGEPILPDINSLREMAEGLGIDLKTGVLPENIRSILIPAEGNARAGIFLAAGLSVQEACFAAGHGIGHLILGHHFSATDPMSSHESCKEYLKNEYDANYVAAALLMDARILRDDPDIDIHDIDITAEKYNVSYETAAQRIAALSDIDMYFLKIDHSGHILKRYIKTDGFVDWLNIRKICNKWGMMKAVAIKSKRCFVQKSILLDRNKKILDTLYFASKYIEKKGEKYAVALGCKYSEADKLKGFVDNLADIEVSMRSCPNPKTCELRLCYSSFAPV